MRSIRLGLRLVFNLTRRRPWVAVFVLALWPHAGACAASSSDPFATATIQMNSAGTLPALIQFSSHNQPTLDAFLAGFNAAVGLSSNHSLRLLETTMDQLGENHHRFAQLYRGVPILGGELIVHERDGLVRAANGTLATDLNLDPQPALDENAALAAALARVGAQTYMWQDPFWENELRERTHDSAATYYPRGELCWAPTTFGTPGEPPAYKLAYQFDIHAASPNKAQRVVVDARSGEIIATLPLESNCTGASVNSIFNGNQGISTDKFTANDYRLRDDCQTATIRIRDWNSTTLTASPVEIQNTTNTWTTMNERFGASVLWATKQAYLFYLNTFSRNSYDNSNGGIEGYINAVFDCSPPSPCTYTDNASMSFSGGTLKVGLGSSGTLANSWSTLDILAHEYTHAVTGATAKLVYSNESGALNESFSDIFGEVVQNYVTGSLDWLVGAQRTNGAIRSMSNPNTFSDPDTYQGTNWYTGTNDNGGVHTNSGVQNFWFYLLAQGGSGTNDKGWAYSFSGIGLDKATAIAYRNLTVYLTSGSAYADARTGAIAAAADLYGAGSTEWQTVIKAWRAVGIDPCEITCSDYTTSNDAGQCGATVNYPAPTNNGQCFTVTTDKASGSFFPVGTTTVVATSTSGATCSFDVTVNDTEAPSITCPGNITQANDPGQCGAAVTFSPTASDNCPGVTVSSLPPSGSFFPVGTTTVTSTATDVAGNTASCSFTVTVLDTEPPAISVASGRCYLWPPNHKMVTIDAAVTVTDNCPGVTFKLVSVTSDEPVDNGGDGTTAPDIAGATPGTPDTEFQLRAERSGKGDGRVYTIVYTATDASGNTAQGTAEVLVPHDMSGTIACLSGLTPDGRAVDPSATSVVFMIPNAADNAPRLDDQQTLPCAALLGNAVGYIPSTGDRLEDVDGDGTLDRIVSFAAQPIRELAGASLQTIGFHYVIPHRGTFLVDDIFGLGAPVAWSGSVPVATAEAPASAGDHPAAALPIRTRLTGVRPSPFSTSTMIGFDLAQSQPVRIDVFDVAGRLVKSLVSENRLAGSHVVEWDGRDTTGRRVLAGVYLVRFQSAGADEKVKVVRTN